MTWLLRFLSEWFYALLFLVAALVLFSEAAYDVWKRWRYPAGFARCTPTHRYCPLCRERHRVH